MGWAADRAGLDGQARRHRHRLPRHRARAPERPQIPVRGPREQTEEGTARRTKAGAAQHRRWEGIVVRRHSRFARRSAAGPCRHPARNLGAAVAGLVVVAGTLAIYGATGIGVAPAADTVLELHGHLDGRRRDDRLGHRRQLERRGARTPPLSTPASPAARRSSISDASFSVGELTVAKGSTLSVGTGGTGRHRGPRRAPALAVGLLGPGERRDADRRAVGSGTADPDPRRARSRTPAPSRRTGARHRRRQRRVEPDQLRHARGRSGRRARSRSSSSTSTNTSTGLLAFGIDGPPTSPSDYGRITNGASHSTEASTRCSRPGSPPRSGAEYVVYDGSYSGTFATVLNDATADYSPPERESASSAVHRGGHDGRRHRLRAHVGLRAGGAPHAYTVGHRAPSATVTPSSGSDPTGSVTFSRRGVVLGSATGGDRTAGVTTATLDTSNLPVGSQPVTATYGGDVVFGARHSPVVTQVVQPDSADSRSRPHPPTRSRASRSPTRSPSRAAAPGAGTPTGTVSLTDDGSPVAGCQSLTLSSTASPQVTCSETYGCRCDPLHRRHLRRGRRLSDVDGSPRETVAPVSDHDVGHRVVGHVDLRPGRLVHRHGGREHQRREPHGTHGTPRGASPSPTTARHSARRR